MNTSKSSFLITLFLVVVAQSCDPVKVLTIHNKSSSTVSICFNKQRGLTVTWDSHGAIYNIHEGDSLIVDYGMVKWSKAQKQEVDSTIRLLTLPTNVEAFYPQPWKKKAKRKGLFNNALYVVIKE